MKTLKQNVRLVRINMLEMKDEIRRNRSIMEKLLRLVEGRSIEVIEEQEQSNGLPDEFPSLPIETEEALEKLEELLDDQKFRSILVSSEMNLLPLTFSVRFVNPHSKRFPCYLLCLT